MVVHHTARGEYAPGSPGTRRVDRSVHPSAAGTTLCRHCDYNPASPRIFGYCSWDCHDADDADDAEGDKAA
jgi:hypothetical protein